MKKYCAVILILLMLIFKKKKKRMAIESCSFCYSNNINVVFIKASCIKICCRNKWCVTNQKNNHINRLKPYVFYGINKEDAIKKWNGYTKYLNKECSTIEQKKRVINGFDKDDCISIIVNNNIEFRKSINVHV